jgi:hypothetical protein
MILDFGLLIRQLFHFAALYWELVGSFPYESTYKLQVLFFIIFPALFGYLGATLQSKTICKL